MRNRESGAKTNRRAGPGRNELTLMGLRPYQKEAVAKALSVMRDGGGFGLFLEQRVGKTITALTIAAEVQPEHLWVICPKAAIPIWEKALSGGVVIEEDGRQYQALPDAHRHTHVRIENYEQAVAHKEKRYDEAKKLKDLMVICDESHYIKKRGTARSTTTRHIGKYARWRLALTGTPIAQGIQDAWAQFNFIDRTIFGKFDNTYADPKTKKKLLEYGFDGRYLVWGGHNKKEIVDYINEKEFYEKFHAHSYRQTLHEARIAPLKLRYTRVPVQLSARSRAIYNSLKTELEAEVNKRKIRVKNVLACLVKLQQVTGGSVIVHERPLQLFGQNLLETIGCEKLDALHGVVRSFRSRTKFVVIARFIHEVERIAASLRQKGYTVGVVRGGQPYDGTFAQDCLVLQIQSGIAVDLSHADECIFYSIDFSMLNFEQARFRILNYDKPGARYHFLLAERTTDEQIYEAVRTKKRVADLVCDVYRWRNNVNR